MKRIENASSKQCHGSSVEADPEEEAWPKNGFRCQSLSSYQKLVGIGRGRIRTYVENHFLLLLQIIYNYISLHLGLA